MNPLYRILSLSFGSLLCAISVNAYLAPNKLLSGGASGIAIILNNLFNINIGLIILLINIPLFMISYKKLDKDFIKYSLINMLIYSFIIGSTTDAYKYIGVNDLILSAIFGGVLNGIGMFIIFRNKGSQGGTDILAKLVKQKWDVNLGSALMGFNLVIVSTGGLVFGIKKAMYTLISMYVAYQVLDKIQDSIQVKKSAMVISDSSEEISKDIMNEMGRGVTFLQGEGGYSKDSKKVIYTIINPIELPKLKEIVEKYDEHAFISINETQEVRGRGFKQGFI
ncbi:YitT family protein [Tepidibacter formicigenes]|jgi:uncharacterized membrane-anchored protein YitT (DUF2179 family)|uniref:Uncharacterized membrane-anchored protein YitT, contains DUF161 and DUF2179 domains n=1 Tax=Tepidibacter formicigenes DSM 15518 TaxID=1123349 RepID=A0A1M6R1A7_9FIRM|nr:YitT family protein [Tepidibacter formicigenes]SHK26138.1 Uncharacterized membrane-anchored protein YitT, contains DUF161 and DUF2179 domains [Tepidibacter formicigenes DSM 15518]